MDDPELLKDLNDEQLAAVTHGDGPMMIVAGAGTGKTTVITKRIAWLIQEGRARPEEILALTFTDKAATEMEERVDRLLPIGYIDLSISTFHAFCEKVLREHGVHIGLSPDFKVATEVDSWLLMRRHIDKFKLDYFKPLGNPTKFFRLLLQHFSRAKDEGIFPDQYAQWVEDFVTKLSGGGMDALAAMKDEDKLEATKWQELAHAYATYEQLLHDQAALDFGGLLSQTVKLFELRPNILKDYRNRFKYIVVDEFQDTNSIQYKLVKLLSEPRRNITVVGDDDQAIYKFRGAALTNILSFRDDFPEAKKIVLTMNYRSGKNILDQAYKLIQANNPHRLEAAEGLSKALKTNLENPGFVRHLHCQTSDDEIEVTVKEILKLQVEQSCAWSDFAILVRANDAAEPFLEGLERAGIPYRFVAMSGLYTQPIIMDALAYLRLVHLSHNSPAAYRVLSHPRLGISEQDLSALLLYVRRKGLSIMQALDRLTSDVNISAEGRTRLVELNQIVSDLKTQAKRLPVTELFLLVLKRTGLLTDIGVLDEGQQQEIFKHLEGFFSRLKRFAAASEDKSLSAFLDEFEAERSAGEAGALKVDEEVGPDVVQVMTIHGAKGLEFKYVFVVNLIEQRFPSVSRSEALPLPAELVSQNVALDDHIAEERRLFYVAMTRAKVGLYFLSADDYGGTRKRKLSRFLTELGFEPKAQSIERSEVFKALEKPERVRELNQDIPDKISFSQIAAYTTCPLQYKFAHVLKVPAFGRQSLSFGKTMHNTLHQFLTQVKNNQDAKQTSLFDVGAEPAALVPPLKVLQELYANNFIDEWYASDEERDQYRDLGWASLQKFHVDFSAAPPKLFALEMGFSLKLADICLKGRIDRIDELPDGSLEVIDYKTGKPKDQLTWEDKRQLILYAMALEKCLSVPKPISKLSFYYLNNGYKLSFEFTDKDKDKLVTQITQTMERIEAGDFAPTPDPIKCLYCDFKDICPFSKA